MDFRERMYRVSHDPSGKVWGSPPEIKSIDVFVAKLKNIHVEGHLGGSGG